MNHANFNCSSLIKEGAMIKKLWLGISLIIIVVFAVAGYVMINHQNQDHVMTAQQKITQVSIVALGDSLTQGVGDNQNLGGYPKRVGKLLAQKAHVKTKVFNFGKAGDRSDQIMNNLNQNDEQKKAIKKADVILLTAGGNDLIKQLQGEVVGHSAADVEQIVATTMPQYQKKLTQLLMTIREYNPQASIFLFGNYNPLYVYFPDFTTFNNSVKMYNAVNRTVVNQYHGHYVSVFKQLTYGQYQSKQAQKELQATAADNKISFLSVLADAKADNTEKNRFISTADHFHPNAHGYDFMAREMVKKMLLYDTWSKKNNEE